MWIKSPFHRSKIKGAVQHLAIKMGDAGTPVDHGIIWSANDLTSANIDGVNAYGRNLDKTFLVWLRSRKDPNDVMVFSFTSPTEAVKTFNIARNLVQMISRSSPGVSILEEHKQRICTIRDAVTALEKALC